MEILRKGSLRILRNIASGIPVDISTRIAPVIPSDISPGIHSGIFVGIVLDFAPEIFHSFSRNYTKFYGRILERIAKGNST